MLKKIFGIMTLFFVFCIVSSFCNADEGFINLAEGLSYQVSIDPAASYSDEDYELTDGQYGSLDNMQPAWVGYLRKNERTIIFDLEKEKSVGKIVVNSLQNYRQGIYFPDEVNFFASNDGKKWKVVGKTFSAFGHAAKGEDEIAFTQKFIWDGKLDPIIEGNKSSSMVYARYFKISFPVDVWVFLDEIEILGINEYSNEAIDVKMISKEEIIESKQYPKPSEKTANINNLVLMYNNYYGYDWNWTKDILKPYVAYLDENGRPLDWFFDGFLILGRKTASGRTLDDASANPSNQEDWDWYLNKIFKPEGIIVQLDQTVEEVKSTLDLKEKIKIVMMVPYPSVFQDDFGDLNGDGISESFSNLIIGEDKAYMNRKNAIFQYVSKMTKKWQEGNYKNLELAGLYWMSEAWHTEIPKEEELIQFTSKLAHCNNWKFFWIPYFKANGYNKWAKLGFDVASLQPNYAFKDVDNSRLNETAKLAKENGMSIEIEMNWDLLKSTKMRQKYIDYLNKGVEFGYMKAFKSYYQDRSLIFEAYKSKDPKNRVLYDWTYQFAKNKYEVKK